MLKVLLRAGLIATWTSLQINLDSVVKPHSDLGCVGLSIIQLAGSFTEGAFRTQKWKLDTPAEIVVFDGRKSTSRMNSRRRGTA